MFNRLGKQVSGLAAVAVLVSGTTASAIIIQPDEANSKDVFTYQLAVPNAGFDIPGAAAVTNLDFDSLAPLNPATNVGILLGTAATSVVDHASINGGTSIFTGNDTHTWIQFDLPVGVNAGDVVSATLNLWALDGRATTGGAFDNPAPGQEVTTRLYEADATWGEQIITWNNADPRNGPKIGEIVQDSVGNWVTFNVTGTVQNWLSGAKVNSGFFLDQKDVVFSNNPGGLGGLEGVVASLYASSAWGDASLRPYLEITLVPEPSTLALTGIGIGLLATARRRRQGYAS